MNQERVTALVKQRSCVRSSFTRIKTFLENVSTVDRSNLLVRYEKLEPLYEKFLQIHEELCVIAAEQAPDEALGNFETEYFEVKAKFLNLLGTDQVDSNNPQLVQNTVQFPTSHIGSSLESNPEIKLPKLQLPTFSGNLEDWPSFSELFKSIVHDNAKLPNIQKLYYLKSCLKGDAQQLLQSLPSTDQNYSEAWEILTLRYDNKRLIINSHLSGLFNQASLQGESSQGLRRLVDDTENHIRALKSLGEKVDAWDSVLVHTVSSKLDRETRKQWEMSLTTSDIPSFEQLKLFLIKRINALGSSHLTSKPQIASRQSTSSHRCDQSKPNPTKNKSFNHFCCVVCENPNHFIYQCGKFNQMNVNDRINEVKKHKLCFNCLKPNHSAADCYNSNCKTCNKNHHTMLHIEVPNNTDKQSKSRVKSSNHTSSESEAQSTDLSNSELQVSQVLLSTAVIFAENHKGEHVQVRALLDSGAQSNFITKSCVDKLHLSTFNSCVTINGIGNSKTKSSRRVNLNINSRIGNYGTQISAIVLPAITTKLPRETIDHVGWSQKFSSVLLADPEFYKPSEIDLLMGAEVFFDLLTEGKIAATNSSPTLQNTVFGWIVAGRCGHKTNDTESSCNFSIDNQLKKFWEIEECVPDPVLTKEEQLCEQHFKDNVRRDESGRFIVKLPFNNRLSELGESKQIALNSFKRVEHRLSLNCDRKEQYNKFINEYLNLGHMECVGKLIDVASKPGNGECFLPHHEVIKESSSTTKLRVVFNASCPTSTRVSLNDTLMVGPRVQQDLFSIIARFRLHEIVMVADCEKMYRQILVDEEDCKFQQILWREKSSDPIKVYQLRTVTYGTASAPFLATRGLKQLAEEETTRFPIACAAASTDFYVDDLLTGAHNLESALQLQRELSQLLHSGGFKLRKWCSNRSDLLDTIPVDDKETNSINLDLGEKQKIKTLGVTWEPSGDTFQIIINLSAEKQTNLTKREMLKDISKLFDPLGLISPLVILPKIMLQQLWLTGVGWDEPVSVELSAQWHQMKNELLQINNLSIPRQVTSHNYLCETIELIGFCDASEKAYAACVYVRSVSASSVTEVKLLCSKTRVAPIKQISLPRLELCGALLVSRLLNKTACALNISVTKCYAFTDSTIVLCWLAQAPNRWKTFVANRVAEIQDSIPPTNWSHVISNENPADLASRGSSASEFQKHEIWWNGPQWLKQNKKNWPRHNVKTDLDVKENIPEIRKSSTQAMVAEDKPTLIRRLLNFSSFFKIVTILAFILRFTSNLRTKPEERRRGALSGSEIDKATKTIIKLVQNESFAEDIRDLKKHGSVKPKSKLKSLFPFIDQEGFLRVGGRLENANISFDAKHQLLLPAKHEITRLMIRNEHIKHLHAGAQLIQNVMRQKYWIINIKNEIKTVLRNCVTCLRYKASTSFNIMGNLPIHRVTSGRAFSTVGIDFAGPITTKGMGGRTKILLKSYIAIFICLITKAVHIEVVSDLSTETFLNALRRFVSRRGLPKHIYSDNATNFKGAYNHLQREITTSSSVARFSQENNIDWHFIPPSSPHFSGLWESAIKSMKNHLTRVMGNQVLNFEELSTLLAQIEACLNSRPLSSMSSDPRDINVLTPGHFLVFTPLTAVPNHDSSNEKVNVKDRWRLIEQLHQQFWRRWSCEYLNGLQQRNKWKEVNRNLKIGDLVIIKEDNIHPCTWNTARIQCVHPGDDGVVRVVTLKSAKGVFKRHISKLIVLPTE